MRISLFLYLCLLCPFEAQASNIGSKEFKCPICQKKFKSEIETSSFQTGKRLDLKPLGAISAPSPIPVCPKCSFVLYKEDLKRKEKKVIKEYLYTNEFKQFLSDKHTSYYLLAKILSKVESDQFDLGVTYLKASWQAEEEIPNFYLIYLIESLEHFDSYLSLSQKDSEDWTTACMVKGEILRLLSGFEKAEKYFKELKGQEGFDIYPCRQICDYELELIQKKDSSPHPGNKAHRG